MDLVSAWALLLLALIVLVRGARGAGWARWALGAGVLAVVAGAFAVRPRARPARADPDTPARTTPGEYVSSAACRSCHPSEYASWHRSFHRTMTQEPGPAMVGAPVFGSDAPAGAPARLEARDGAVWATYEDPDATPGLAAEAGGSAPRITRRVVLATGSHHYQGYWTSGPRPGELAMLPWVYLVAEERWILRRDAFVQPPDAPQHDVHWSSNCIQCHATAGRPGYDPDGAPGSPVRSEVVELGIACEACHGPGGAHVRKHRSPLERYEARGLPDPSIVDPARLSPAKASALCGQCHAYAYPKDEDDWWRRGYTRSFRPGQRLDASRTVLSLDDLDRPGAPWLDASARSIFWSDGAIRVGGREYNALTASRCFAGGHGDRKLSCLSCHSMHDHERGRVDPVHQVTPGKDGDGACAGCHADVVARGEAHTHHAPGSAGAACMGCHMPRTTYALLGAMRSHRIDSPSVAVALATGRPTACNLCHVDRTLAWTEDRLAAWYGQPRHTLDARDRTVSATVRAALQGDAAQRAIAAFALGTPEARAASGGAWEAPVLAALTSDPYAAVRAVAARSARALAGAGGAPHDPAAVLEGAGGAPDPAALHAILVDRDDRAVTISE